GGRRILEKYWPERSSGRAVDWPERVGGSARGGRGAFCLPFGAAPTDRDDAAPLAQAAGGGGCPGLRVGLYNPAAGALYAKYFGRLVGHRRARRLHSALSH